MVGYSPGINVWLDCFGAALRLCGESSDAKPTRTAPTQADAEQIIPDRIIRPVGNQRSISGPTARRDLRCTMVTLGPHPLRRLTLFVAALAVAAAVALAFRPADRRAVAHWLGARPAEAIYRVPDAPTELTWRSDGRRYLWGGTGTDQHFDVTRCRIDLSRLEHGLGREAFAALTNPAFDTADAADRYLDATDALLVIRIGEVVKAYPLSVLHDHEAVNDAIDGRAYLVAYCWLADLAAVYERRIAGRRLTFAVSGYTYADPDVWGGRNAFILWDRQTESLWWPPVGRAVAGSLTDTVLPILDRPLWRRSTWAELRRRHPDVRVLRPGQVRPADAGDD